MKIINALRALPREAGHAFLRTPLEVLLGAAAWLGLAVAIERSVAEDAWTRLAVVVAIALPLVYATSVLFATGTINRWTRWLAAGAMVTAAALYGFHRFDPDLAAEGWRAALLAATAIFALLSVPLMARAPAATRPEQPASRTDPDATRTSPRPGDLLSRGPDAEHPRVAGSIAYQPLAANRRGRTHLFATRLAVRVIIVGLYAAALYAGLAAALGAVNGLFELKLPDRLYAHLAALVFVLMPPWAVAAGLPDLVAPPGPWSAATLRALRRTALFLLAALIAVYLLIVYAYAVRMFVTGEVPSNLVSPVVLGAGILTLVATILLEPLHGRDDAIGLTRFLRLLPALLLPLTALALWAVLIRVEQHGWTEFRYLRVLAVLLLGAFAAAGSWRLFRRLLPPLAWLPASTAALLLLAAVGPLSAPAVSYRSQQARLTALLPDAERSTTDLVPVASELLADITNRAAYLRDHFGWDALEPSLPPGTAKPKNRSPIDLAAALGLVEQIDSALPRVVNAALPADTGIPGIDGGTLYLVDYQKPSPAPRPSPVPPRTGPAPRTPATGTALRTETDSLGSRITIHPPAGPELSADLGRLARQLANGAQDQPGDPIYTFDEMARRSAITARSVRTDLPVAEAVIPLHDPNGQPRGQLLLRNLTIRAAGDSTTLESWGGFVLVRN
jgi:hypothetical protein